jgi:hypothetical protein
MAHFLIFKDSGWGTCDDCGSYNWASVKVYEDGSSDVAEYYYDGHLAGGRFNDEDDFAEGLLVAFELSGHSAEIKVVERSE